MSFLENFDWFRLPLDKWIEYLFGMDSWIVNNGGPVFDVIRFPVRAMLDNIEFFFLWLPWPVVIISAALIGWRMAGISVSIFVSGGLFSSSPLRSDIASSRSLLYISNPISSINPDCL